LNVELGSGEFFYIHAIAFHSYLGHPADDGPEQLLAPKEQKGINTNVEISLFEEDSTFGRERTLQRYRRNLVAILRNQHRAGAEAGDDEVVAALQEALQAAIGDLVAGGERAYAQGLPAVIEASLAPYRQRLEASYSPLTNIFDMYAPQADGWRQVEEDEV
jgi:hypothetical protein